MRKILTNWLRSMEKMPAWAVFGGIVAPLLAVLIFSFTEAFNILTQSTLERRREIAYLAANVVKENLDGLKDLAVSFATRSRLQSLLRDGKWEEAADSLKSIQADFPQIDRLFLADVAGTERAAIPATGERIGKNFSQRDWYRGVSRAWEPHISEVYRRTAPPPINVVAVAAPVKDAETGQVLGILALQIPVEKLLPWTKPIPVGTGGFVYVVDRRGRVVSHPKYPPQGEIVDYSGVPAVREALSGKQGILVQYNPIEKEERLSAFTEVPVYGWGVVAQEPVRNAFAYRNKTIRILFITYLLFLLVGGGFALFISTLMDSIKKARNASRLLASIVESSNDAIIGKKLDGTIVSWNKGAERIYGYTAQEMIGRPIADIVPEDRRGELRDILLRIGRGQKVQHYETVRCRKDGSAVDVSITVSAIRDEHGSVVGASAISRDISDKKALEKEQVRLIEELKKALAQVRTLKGLIPICASCKKIRDDKGFWHEVEIYVRDHSDAEFSHGLCKECTKILYPAAYKKMHPEEESA